MLLSTLIYLYSHPNTDEFTRQLISNILKDIHNIPELSASELADRCFVSLSALRNFIKSLGFASYSEFKVTVSMTLRSNNDPLGFFDLTALELSVEEAFNSMAKSFIPAMDQISEEMLTRAADAILNAERIVFCAKTSNSINTQFLSQLIMLDKEIVPVFLPKRFSDAVAHVDTGTLVILNPFGNMFEGYTNSDLDIVAERGGKSILITNRVIPSAVALADYPLCFTGTGTLYDIYVFDAVLLTLTRRLINTKRSML